MAKREVTRQDIKNLLVACIGTKIVRPEDWLGGKILRWRPSEPARKGPFKDGEEALREICKRVDDFLDEVEARDPDEHDDWKAPPKAKRKSA